MKILVIIILLLGLLCFAPGLFGNSWEKSANDRENEAFMGFVGFVLLALDFVIFIIWQLFKS